ncbi:ACT domain-containing protein [Elusimicrobiota bacterium]
MTKHMHKHTRAHKHAHAHTHTQYTIPTHDRPGALWKITHALHKHKINITAMMTEGYGDTAYIRFLTDKHHHPKKHLEKAGFHVMETPCFHIELPNHPGALNHLTKTLALKHISLHHVYGTSNGHDSAKVVVVVDNAKKAGPVLAKWMRKPHAN